MATAHHLAVITNSCVKPPVNPDTGLTATIDERPSISLSGTWHGRDDEHDSDRENRPQNGHLSHTANGTVLFNKTESMLQDVTSADLANLRDEEFYNRLVELKEEHKKTLQLCENLYNEKLGHTLKETQQLNDSREYTNNQNTINRSMTLEASKKSLDSSFDRVRDMSASMKPPVGKSHLSKGRPQTTKSRMMSKSGGSNKPGKQAWAGRSSDEEFYWKAMSAASTDHEYSGDENGLDRSYGRKSKKDTTLNDSHNSAMSRIEDMWENFSVDEYAPRSMKTRPRSASLSRMSTTSSSASKDWRHRITVPDPFTMTIRDELKDRTKSRTLEEFEKEREDKKRREEEECQKQFKATPVPAHVYMPLFDEVIEKQEAQRRYNKEHCEELLKSQEKPFKFMKREEETKKNRKSKFQAYAEETDKSKKTVFKARPVPDYLFDDNTNEKIAEEEFYRKIRVQMRAEELLKTSSLPPNMAARGEDYVMGKSRQKSQAQMAKKVGLRTEPSFRPKINDTVPDFEEMHRNFQKKMFHFKSGKEATVCKPFKLRTSKIVSSKDNIYEDMSRDEDTLRENRWPFTGSRARIRNDWNDTDLTTTSRGTFSTNMKSMRSMSSSMDSIPTKLTQAATLRASATKARMEKQIERELAELEAERNRKLKEKRLRKNISQKAAANDMSRTLKQTNKDKLKEFREAERARQQEYRMHLREIEDRVGSRPLLFERTVQDNAKRAAEKRYMDTLRREGIDEDFIKKKSSLAGSSIHDDTGLSDDDDDDYTRSYHSRTHSLTRSRTHSRSEDKKYSDDFDDGSDGAKTPQEFSEVEDEIADEYD